MIAARLVEMIEIHASRLAADVTRDLATNPRTPGFRKASREELEQRVYRIFHHLGNWIGDPAASSIEAEFWEWGSRRFDQGISVLEVPIETSLRCAELGRDRLHRNGIDAAPCDRS